MELRNFAPPESLIGISLALGNVKESIVQEPILARLKSCGRDQEWLMEIANDLQKISDEGASEAITRVTEMCQFLSWVCAPLKGNNSWSTINSEAFRYTSNFYAKRSLPRKENLQLLCWVVTYSFDKTELSHPALMPFHDVNSDLVLGYLNLLEHINSHAWEAQGLEIDTTSLTVRLAGIVNALDRNQDLVPALTDQIRKLRGIISDQDYKIYDDAWIKEFVDIRNAISHVSERGMGLSLEQAWERSKDLSQVRSIIRLGSYLMANEVRQNLLEFPFNGAASWADRFDEELGWYK